MKATKRLMLSGNGMSILDSKDFIGTDGFKCSNTYCYWF